MRPEGVQRKLLCSTINWVPSLPDSHGCPMCHDSRDEFYGEVDQDAGITGATAGREPVAPR